MKEIDEQEQDLINIYGPKIRVVQWMFENDIEVQQLAADEDEYGDEKDDHDGKKFEFINGVGF